MRVSFSVSVRVRVRASVSVRVRGVRVTYAAAFVFAEVLEQSGAVFEVAVLARQHVDLALVL